MDLKPKTIKRYNNNKMRFEPNNDTKQSFTIWYDDVSVGSAVTILKAQKLITEHINNVIKDLHKD